MSPLHEDDRRPDLRAYPLPRLVEVLAAMGEKPYRARQLYRWLHRRGAASFDEMTDLPAALRARLAEAFELRTLAMAEEHRSSDGTIKWRWRTVDGLSIESVYMPHAGSDDEDGDEPRSRERRTLCVSSQVAAPSAAPSA